MSPVFRRLSFAPLIAAALALAPMDVDAGRDFIAGTRGDEAMTEVAHRITLTFERGYARMVVVRTVHNELDRHDEAAYDLELPDGGVAVGLRTLGERRGKPHWYSGELLEAKVAADRYVDLTGFEPHELNARDPALLAWGRRGWLTLQVFPVAPGTDKTVEYTVDIPAEWSEGRWTLELPDLGLDGQPAELLVSPSHAGDRVFLDDQVIEAGQTVLLDNSYTLALVPHEPAALELELASVATGSDRALTHWRVTAAPELSQLPKRAELVVALDLSRSLTDDLVEAQRQAALAYLDHFGDPALGTKVAVFGFDHRIRPVTDGFVAIDEALSALRGARLDRGNGSAIDLALAEADRLFERDRSRAPRRLLLMTDFATGSSHTLAEYEMLADETDAIVHLAELSVGSPGLVRDDAHPWASVAARTEGVVWQASVEIDGDPSTWTLAASVFEEWARPIRVDQPRVEIDGVDVIDGWAIDSLDEGEGLDDLDLTDLVAQRMTVTGLSWNHRVEHELRRSPSLSRRWAALVFGTWLSEELDEEERLTLALEGGAVSPVTSYLAVEPGVRPSNEGFRPEAGTIGLGNIGLISKAGCGIATEYGTRHGAGFGGRLDRQAWLDEQLGDAWQACGGAGQPGTLELEANYDEILDFTLVGATDPALTTCMEARIWAIVLPESDFIDDRSRWIVALR